MFQLCALLLLHYSNFKNKIAACEIESDKVTCCESFGVGVVVYKKQADEHTCGTSSNREELELLCNLSQQAGMRLNYIPYSLFTFSVLTDALIRRNVH